jgi:hypothetical protein
MFVQLENLAAIGPFAFENRTRIMKAMGKHVNLRIRPLYEFAIHPDEALKLVKGNGCHANLLRDAPAFFETLRISCRAALSG